MSVSSYYFFINNKWYNYRIVTSVQKLLQIKLNSLHPPFFLLHWNLHSSPRQHLLKPRYRHECSGPYTTVAEQSSCSTLHQHSSVPRSLWEALAQQEVDSPIQLKVHLYLQFIVIVLISIDKEDKNFYTA